MLCVLGMYLENSENFQFVLPTSYELHQTATTLQKEHVHNVGGMESNQLSRGREGTEQQWANVQVLPLVIYHYHLVCNKTDSSDR